jgi:hypothetical protein
MTDSEQPLATPLLEEHVLAMFREGLSAEEYAARWAHTIACFSLDEYRYRDPQLHVWIHALGDILFQRPGAPTLEDLRARYLTPEEHEAIREELESGEF